MSNDKINNVKLGMWNCEGLRNALDLLDATEISNFDIMIFTETFLKKPNHIPGFYERHVFASQKEAGRPTGGIAVYFNSKAGVLLNVKYLNNFLILNFEEISVIACYLKPNIRASTVTDELLSTLKYVGNFKNLIFAGDFNCRLDKMDKKTEALLDFMEENDLTLVNNFPYSSTYVCSNGSSVIDLIFRGSHISAKNFCVKDTFLRKHRMVSVDFSYISKDETIEEFHARRKFKINSDLLKEIVENKYIDTIRKDLVDENLDSFYNNIICLLKESEVPRNQKARISQPWFDQECYKLRELLNDWKVCLDAAERFWQSDMRLLTSHYTELKKQYKWLCVNKKRNFVKAKEELILKEAEQNKCYRVLSLSKNFHNTNNIMMNEWESNFENIFNERNLKQDESLKLKDLLENYESDRAFEPIMQEEVTLALRKMKNGKAAGPDCVSNENVKMLAELLLPEITTFFNICLKKGTCPTKWREATLKLLYKGKGDSEDTNSYRGICVSSAFYNLLDRVLHARMYASLIPSIPKNQYGFVRGKSTIQAVRRLVKDINQTVYNDKTPLFGLFLDVKKAFDSIDRPFIFQKLIDSGKLSCTELNFLAHNLDLNFLRIVDGVTLSKIITQSNGVRQGGCTSPFLFNFSLADINNVLHDLPSVKALFYADDIVLTSQNIADLREALKRIRDYLLLRNLKLNLEKCKIMKFRNQGKGRYSKDDILVLDDVEIERVTVFTYLGVVFQPSGISFSRHVEKRMRAALFATFNIKELHNLSMETALKLFDLKVSPIASYGIEIIWPHLTIMDLENIERVKSRYLKRVMGLSKYNRSRYVYELADTDLFVSDLKIKFSLPDTQAYVKFYERKCMNKLEIVDEFYETETMLNLNWQRAMFSDRSVFTRFACHGYHYVFCNNKKFHAEATPSCKCLYCNNLCTKYHILECQIKRLSLREASKIKFKSVHSG